MCRTGTDTHYANEQEFREKNPHIPFFTPSSSEDYESRRKIYQLDCTAVPHAIACPRNAGEASELVRYAVGCNIPLTVRSGGHDPYGRCIVDGALCIDVRAIDSVEVAADRKTARIGGGVFAGRLINELSKGGLTAVFPGTPSVGYVGWAIYGGYGAFTGQYGLGVDQIVGAEVVDSYGQVVKADDEMVKGIRGGGGHFGVIVSLSIKVYEAGNVSALPCPSLPPLHLKNVYRLPFNMNDTNVTPRPLRNRSSPASSSSTAAQKVLPPPLPTF